MISLLHPQFFQISRKRLSQDPLQAAGYIGFRTAVLHGEHRQAQITIGIIFMNEMQHLLILFFVSLTFIRLNQGTHGVNMLSVSAKKICRIQVAPELAQFALCQRNASVQTDQCGDHSGIQQSAHLGRKNALLEVSFIDFIQHIADFVGYAAHDRPLHSFFLSLTKAKCVQCPAAAVYDQKAVFPPGIRAQKPTRFTEGITCMMKLRKTASDIKMQFKTVGLLNLRKNVSKNRKIILGTAEPEQRQQASFFQKKDAQLISIRLQRFFRNAAAGLVRGQIVFRFVDQQINSPRLDLFLSQTDPGKFHLPFHFLITALKTVNQLPVQGIPQPKLLRVQLLAQLRIVAIELPERLVNILNVATPGHHRTNAHQRSAIVHDGIHAHKQHKQHQQCDNGIDAGQALQTKVPQLVFRNADQEPQGIGSRVLIGNIIVYAIQKGTDVGSVFFQRKRNFLHLLINVDSSQKLIVADQLNKNAVLLHFNRNKGQKLFFIQIHQDLPKKRPFSQIKIGPHIEKIPFDVRRAGAGFFSRIKAITYRHGQNGVPPFVEAQLAILQ